MCKGQTAGAVNAAGKHEDRNLIRTLSEHGDLSDKELLSLLAGEGPDEALFAEADRVRREHYGDAVFLRGLIEFTNCCENDCYYCGIRRSNARLQRYRLDQAEILACCEEGYGLGYRTFVLQGGEDPYYTDEILCGIVSEIHERFPDCAVTLSAGERTTDSYQRLFDAGARRYLLRHEAASEELYRKLHPEEMRLGNRMRCLWDLKRIGYQVGAGLMVGAPYQRPEHLIGDLRFLQQLGPDMIGIGPYLRHADTPFADFPNGSMRMTLRLLSILRLMFPYALIPSTTALGTIDPQGRELGLKAGANVVMPNLSPQSVRDKYELYDNKICTGEESAQCRSCLEMRVLSAGYRIVTDIGDVRR